MKVIYGQNKYFDKVNQISETMKKNGVKKTPGISWIEIMVQHIHLWRILMIDHIYRGFAITSSL